MIKFIPEIHLWNISENTFLEPVVLTSNNTYWILKVIYKHINVKA